VAIEDGGDVWRRENLQALCTSCHSVKTSREVRARG
jgi:5-methylcytosine-specific restriction endonuclease McrA